jgi:hypothetical protein
MGFQFRGSSLDLDTPLLAFEPFAVGVAAVPTLSRARVCNRLDG